MTKTQQQYEATFARVVNDLRGRIKQLMFGGTRNLDEILRLARRQLAVERQRARLFGVRS